MTDAKNGAKAAITAEAAFTGSHSLLMQATAPVTYTPEAYALPDYDAFIHSGNGGAGGGYTQVVQRVPVTGGKSYILRFHLRTLDFPGGENKAPGPNRGYASLETWVRWEGTNKSLWATNHQNTTPQWTTLIQARFNYYGVPIPYTAPVGAKYADIQFSLANNHAGSLPKAYIDDAEFVAAP